MHNFSVAVLAKDLNLEFLCCEKKAKTNIITEIGISRLGFELTGLFQDTKNHHQCVVLGGKEHRYLKSLTLTQRTASLKRIFVNKDIPVIIISKSFEDVDILLKLANEHEIPVLRCDLYTYSTVLYISPYINSKLWKRIECHGTLVNVFGEGVLITGKSAVGKSETALGLIKDGHFLIADDRVSLYSSGSHLYGEPTNKIAKLLEIRGIGIIDIRYMYGHHVILPHSQIKLNIHLVDPEDENFHAIDRIGNQQSTVKFFHHNIPKMSLQVTAAKNLVDLVETAVISFKLKQEGHDPLENLYKVLTKEIEANAHNDLHRSKEKKK